MISKTQIDKSKLPFSNSYLLSLILPLVLDTALSVAVGIADTMMVARAGEAAVSGVSCINNIQNLLIKLIAAFSTGGSVVICQLLGMSEKERARKASKALLTLSFFISLLICIFCLCGRVKLIKIIYSTVEEGVFTSALLYSIPIYISMPFYAILSSCNAISRSMGRSRVTFLVSLLVNIINVLGNAIFLYIYNLGALGVAIASLISRIIGALIMFIVILDKKKELYIPNPFKFEFDFKMNKLIFSSSLPVGIEKSLFYIGKIVISSTIASFGTASIAAYAVFNNMETLIDIPGTAISLASITVIGQCAGKKDHKLVLYYAKKLLVISYICMAITSIVSFIFTPKIVSLYKLSISASSIAILNIRLDCVCRSLLWPSGFVVPSMLQATGDTKLVMLTATLDMWICRVLFAHLLGVYFSLGLLGTQIGMWLDWLVRAVIFIPRLFGGKWKTKGIKINRLEAK